MGKQYALTAAKLMGNKPSEGQPAEGETYFCSELVGAALKSLGFLPKEVAASNYWPVSFSQEKKLQLIGDAQLCNEMQLNFDI